GCRITTSPPKTSRTTPTSEAIPTAIVSTPSRRHSAASRTSPKPYPWPLTTGTIAGASATTFARCACQRPSSSSTVTPTSAALHVDVEGLVEQRVEGEVPLAQVLHGLAPGADLELDQAQVRVVGLEAL